MLHMYLERMCIFKFLGRLCVPGSYTWPTGAEVSTGQVGEALEACYAKAPLAVQLGLEQIYPRESQGAQHWGCLDRMVGTRTGRAGGSLGMPCQSLWGAALAGQQEHLDPTPTHAFKVEKKIKKWYSLAPPTLLRVPTVPCPFAHTLMLVKWTYSNLQSSCPSNCCFLTPPQGRKGCVQAPLWYPSLIQVTKSRVGVHHYHVSVSPVLLYVPLYTCCAEAVQSAVSSLRRNCCMCVCIDPVCPWGEVSSE